MTTTTANAGRVMSHMEFCHQALWPELDVQYVSVTDQWAQMAVAGPKARRLLERVIVEDHLRQRLSLSCGAGGDGGGRHQGAAVPHLLFGRACL